MDSRAFAKMMGPLSRSIGNMVARAGVRMVKSGSKMQSLQLSILEGETADGVEHFEPFGFTSCPPTGAEAIVLFPNGDRSHGIAIVVADRRYRLTGLASGDAALHDDRGQKVVLTATGIVIDAVAYTVNAPTMINGTLNVTGAIIGGAGIQTAGDGNFGGKSFLGHTNDGQPID